MTLWSIFYGGFGLEKTAFKNLPREKQNLILEGCIEEFARYGYEKASTNRIVKKLGIAKGSLFLYFGNKENLYFTIMEFAIRQVISSIEERLFDLPVDILRRLKKIAEVMIEIYAKKPLLFRLFLGLTEKEAYSFHDRLALRFSGETQKLIENIFKGIKTKNLKYDLESTMEFIRWVLIGIKTDIVGDTRYGSSIEEFKKYYKEKIELAIKFMSDGIYKGGRGKNESCRGRT